MKLTRRGLVGAVSGGIAAIGGCSGSLLGSRKRWEATETPLGGPAVAGSTMFASGNPAMVYAYNMIDGTVQWTAGMDAEAGPQYATVTGGVVLVGDDAGGLYALAAADGSRIWKTDVPGSRIAGHPVIAGDAVVTGGTDGYGAYEFRLQDGSEVARYEGVNDTTTPPAVTAESVYVADRSGTATAFDRQTGERRWQTSLSSTWIQAKPAVQNGRLYVASWDGTLYALDSETGERQWQFDTGKQIHSFPKPRANTVYVGSNSSHLYALSSADGELQWQVATDGSVVAPPVVAGERIYVGDHAGTVYEVSLSGEILWRESVGQNPVVMPAAVTTERVCFTHQSGVVAYSR